MSIKSIIIILILIAIGVYFCMFYSKKQKVYFFLNKDDTNSVESFESLNKILNIIFKLEICHQNLTTIIKF
jgi:hypothetical protein